MQTNIEKVYTDKIYYDQKMIWESEKIIEEIRLTYASKLSTIEFGVFCQLGKATGLNPFLKEIWAIKYTDRDPAQIFIGINGYRKMAHSQPRYDWHQSESVYSNDKFKVINGEVFHEFGGADRGNLVGAYCLVKKRDATKASYVYVDFAEYSGKCYGLWKSVAAGGKPATMIKKVAEAQALRSAFSDLFNGTYIPEEMAVERQNNLKVIDGNTQTEKLNNILAMRDADEKKEKINYEGNNALITNEQIEKLYGLMKEKSYNHERIEKVIDYILKDSKVTDITGVTSDRADYFIQQLSSKK